MGLATVLSFARSVFAGAQAPEAKVSRGGLDTLTAGHFSAPGDDSYPLPDDVVFVADDEGTGNAQVVGYQDPKTSPVATAGEKRIYSRSAPGVVASEVWLKSDGTLLLKNATTSLELKADGSVVVSGAQATVDLGSDGAVLFSNAVGSIKLDAAGLVTFTAPIGSVGAHTHQHLSPFGPTAAPIPGT